MAIIVMSHTENSQRTSRWCYASNGQVYDLGRTPDMVYVMFVLGLSRFSPRTGQKVNKHRTILGGGGGDIVPSYGNGIMQCQQTSDNFEQPSV